VTPARCSGEVAGAFLVLGFRASNVGLLFQLLDREDRILLTLPVRLHAGQFLAQVCEFLVDDFKTFG